ncbi:UNKNOWN [Stylonychia lemnae]|uniref:Uncharacterized protein n=1 Tax=Stylonychia lemnae TaxID=5949 RepID=A0A077ZR84_STYLE|nr:UNKNOWN [Stylonychia lemnae]|eukprot:CDW71964.1 UNKNOWN [Stylonychia lemnae]
MVELHDTQLYHPIGRQESSFLNLKNLQQSTYLSNTIIDCFRYGGPDQYDERSIQSRLIIGNSNWSPKEYCHYSQFNIQKFPNSWIFIWNKPASLF